MQIHNAFWLTLASLTTVCQADLMQYATQLPQCGLNCILGEIPNSACKTVTNSTCICTDTDLFSSVQTCVLAACTVEQALSRLTGFGVDMWTMESRTITTALKVFFIDESFYLALLALCKIAILCFFLRIFPNRWFRYTVFGTISFVALSALIFIFLQIFQCLPVYYNWEGWKGNFGDHRCINVNTLTYSAALIAILQDVIILILPLPLLIGLNTSWRKKVGIILMFSLGIFVLITSCIRLRYIVMFARSLNPTWDYTDTIIWTALEVNVSIVVISLPAIRAYLAITLPKVFATTLRSKSTSDNSSSSRGTGKVLSKQRASKLPSVFSASRRPDGDEAESQLELGDRVHGSTQTEIAVQYDHGDDRSNRSITSQSGIHVQQTTIWEEGGPRGSAKVT
ncbi:hypothetical protein JX265_010964 [Neoarthrinium moseri]|uniref:Rhodopsin domain-containing protein n=1 Tax=Neoarthrinium moseri TaxID=1658444 RepID=A0A9P9WD64_9PEZI|nr:hypothetical protein JX265_010964 [Neoarthrinium moseri]